MKEIDYNLYIESDINISTEKKLGNLGSNNI